MGRELFNLHTRRIQSLSLVLRVRLHASAVFTRLKLRPQTTNERSRQPVGREQQQESKHCESEHCACSVGERAVTQAYVECARRRQVCAVLNSESVLVVQQLRVGERERVHARCCCALTLSESLFAVQRELVHAAVVVVAAAVRIRSRTQLLSLFHSTQVF